MSKKPVQDNHGHHHHDHSHDTHPNQLQPPHEVFHDSGAGEIVRGWITNGHLSLALHAMAFGKADTWGHVLSAIAQQVSASMEEMGHSTKSHNLEIIRRILVEDLAKAAADSSVLSHKA